MDGYDAIVVGARCAGSVLATRLARAGWRVLLVDRATFPSDTLSTHFLFPNTLERLATLGVMERLRASHDIPRLLWSWRVLGHQVAGAFTPVAGEDRLTCIRRVTLDAALVEEALAAGVVGRFGERVSGVVGAGRPGDPVRGVVLAGGDVVRAPWVIGADGRGSTVARALGLAATRELTGNLAFMFGYWTGLPATEWFRMDVREDLSLVCCPCEDGVHQLVLAGLPPLVRGDRMATYLTGIRRFPATINPRLVDRAEMISPVMVAPEPMLRGFFRRACGPGWALAGDAGHFKHPVTAQGISDAVEQAWFVADALLGADPGPRRLPGMARRQGCRALRMVVPVGSPTAARARPPRVRRARRRPGGRPAVARPVHSAAAAIGGLHRREADQLGGSLAGRSARPGRSPPRLTWPAPTPTPAGGSGSCWPGWTRPRWRRRCRPARPGPSGMSSRTLLAWPPTPPAGPTSPAPPTPGVTSGWPPRGTSGPPGRCSPGATGQWRPCSPSGPAGRRPWSRYSPGPSRRYPVRPAGWSRRQWPTWPSTSTTYAAPCASPGTGMPP